MKPEVREKMKAFVKQIAEEQKENEKIRNKFKEIYKKDNPKLLKNFMLKHSSDQNVLSQIITALRELDINQMSDYKIAQRLGESYTECVVYSFKGWYITVNSFSPYVLTSFYKG